MGHIMDNSLASVKTVHQTTGSHLGQIAVVAGIVLLLHVLLILRHFPIESVRQDSPLLSGDLVWHFSDVVEGNAFLVGEGRMWGYSPTYMAGYPFGLWNSVARRGYESATFILRGLSVPQAYWAWIVFMALMPPLIIAFAGWIATRRDAVFAMGLLAFSVVVYQFGSMISYFWTFGNVGFIFATSLSVLYGALLFETCEKGRWIYAVSAGLVLGATGWMHQLAFFPAAVVTAVVLIVQRRVILNGWRWVFPLTALALGGLMLLPWFLDLVEFISIRRPFGEKGALESGWKYMIMDFFSDRAYQHHFDRRLLFHIVVVFGGFGAYQAWRAATRGIAVFFLAGVGLLFCGYVFPYLGELIETCPYRFVICGKLFMLIPAWWGLVQFMKIIRNMDRKGGIAVLCLTLVLAPSMTAYCFDVVGRSPTYGLRPEEKQVVAWFRKQGSPRGRIVSDNGRLSAVLPYFLKCEMLSGMLADTATVKHGWANVNSDVAFGRATAEIAPEVLRDYLVLYNVQYVVCSGVLAGKMELLKDDYREEVMIDGFKIFAAKASRLNWLVGSTNEVHLSVCANKIRIDDASPGTFVIKYHYWPTLESSQGTCISPAYVMDDPVPFMRIENMSGLKTIMISNGY